MAKVTLPNKRLKLPGGDRSKGSECCALARTNYRSMSPRPRASRPQLERDPLGGGRVPSPRCASLVQALGASALRLSFTRERFWNVRSAAALLFLSLLPSAVPPQASLSSTDDPSPPVVDLVFHFETARRLIGLFDRSTISDEDLEGVLRFEDVRAIIRQAARFDSRATDQEFKRSLRAAVEGRELRDDLFQFQTVRARLAAIRTLLRRLQDSTQSLSRQVSDRIRAYSPRELNLQAEVHFVLGGSSDGWVPQPRSFYVALQYFEGDYEGLTLIMAHELRDAPRLLRALLAFVAFSLCASAVYVLNDLLDLESDRQHPTKRHRPFASGDLPLSAGLAGFPLMFGASAILAWQLRADRRDRELAD